jgi:hypothetical protein
MLESMANEGSSNSIRGEVNGYLIVMKSFKFILILYLMYKIMRIIDLFCCVLQQKSLDILNVMNIILITKILIEL